MKGIIMDKVGAAIVLWSSMIFAQLATPAPGDSWEAIAKFGLPTVLTVMLLYGWYQRDKRMSERAEASEDFVKSKLMAIAEESAVSKREVASALVKVAEAIVKCPGPHRKDPS